MKGIDMRKHIILYFFVLLVLGSTTRAGAIYETLDSFMVGVRYQTKITSGALLPDSLLLKFCARAILHTSTVVGGVESEFKFMTVVDTPFYVIPDTVIEILSVMLISGTKTKPLLPYESRLTESIFKLTEFSQLTAGEGAAPRVYNVWADKLQLIPIPVSIDTIYLKCYVEHPALTAGADAIVLQPAFTEAALSYASYLVLIHLDMPEQALIYKKDFNEIAALLIPKYRFRNIDLGLSDR